MDLDVLYGTAQIHYIAASHGYFGITLAKQNPRVKDNAVDWQNVLQVTRENADKEGVLNQVGTLP